MVFTRKMIMNNVQYRSIHLQHKREFMIAIGWALNKGDWWYESDPNKARFFSLGRNKEGNITRYGLYIGRLGIVFMIMRFGT